MIFNVFSSGFCFVGKKTGLREKHGTLGENWAGTSYDGSIGGIGGLFTG